MRGSCRLLPRGKMAFAQSQISANTLFSSNSSNFGLRFSASNITSQKNLKFPLFSQPIESIDPSLSTSSRPIHPQIKLISCRTSCFNDSNLLHFDSDSVESSETIDVSSPSRSGLLRDAAWIGVATFASKNLGLLREIILAAVFGVGPVVAAFKHASVLPSFFTSIIGGVNGPVHIAMATTLSKHSKERGRKLFQNTSSVMFLIGVILGALTFVFAEVIIYFSAPGLWLLSEGRITRQIAISQLKLMIPCIIFSGSVGLGYGRLSAEGNNSFASVNPALSSISIIASCVVYVFMGGPTKSSLDCALFGGTLLACGSSLGIIFQWLTQAIKCKEKRYSSISISWLKILKDKDVNEFFMLLLPATLISGMAQIASFTDLYFASFIPGAAAALSYAHLLAMAPVGILSSVIVLPLIPTFSQLTKSSSWISLMENLKQAILLCMIIILPITSTLCMLAEPVISVLFQRFAFDFTASALVSSLFLCYSIGSPFYITRELLVIVFYALGDGQHPFFISMLTISLNSFLDWLFVTRFYLGAKGLALSTSFSYALSALLLLHLLSKKLTGLLDSMALVGPILWLVACSILSGVATTVAYTILQLPPSSVLILRYSRLSKLLSIALAGTLGIITFFLFAFLYIPGVKLKDLFRPLINR